MKGIEWRVLGKSNVQGPTSKVVTWLELECQNIKGYPGDQLGRRTLDLGPWTLDFGHSVLKA